MASVLPFRAYRPAEGLEKKVSALPYDVIDVNQAKAEAKDNQYSFLHIDKAEIDIENLTDIYSKEVYAKAKENLDKFISDGVLVQDEKPSLYIYRLKDGTHTQTGIAACTLVEEYLNGTIKKHELTREEKQNDRKEHIKACKAHTGPIFMAYRKREEINNIVNEYTKNEPEFRFMAKDGVEHVVWKIDDEETIEKLVNEFKKVGNLYIADGHHRNAAACDVYKEMKENGDDITEAGKYLSVLFPSDELEILSYNRTVADLNGLTEDELIEKLSEKFYIMPYTKQGEFEPIMPHQFGMFINNRWYILTSAEEFDEKPADETVDTAVLYNDLLAPVLGIGDIRTDKRIKFFGGKNAMLQLQLAIITGQAKIAFSLYPTSMEEIMAVADNEKIMPPKSTWFEPKLLSGLFVHKF